jgi:predicted O-methyltransferase YrrM
VFTQIDRDFYLARRDAFVHKYRCFWAVARTIAPQTMIELGVCAGAGADAYLSGWPETWYLGIDTFGEPFSDDDGSAWRELRVDEDSLWKPYDLAEALLAERGFEHVELMVANLRHLTALPRKADLVVVDAAHDYENQYADLRLALTAEPDFVFVDDVDGAETAQAVKQFLEDDLGGRAEFAEPIDYIGGGLVIKLP